MTVRTIDDIFRDFVIDGVPSSGPFNPHKPDIRDTLKKLLEGLSTFPDNRVIRLNNANTGTANNIVVSASVAIPATAYQVLYILNVTQRNTGPVAVSGAIHRSLVTNVNQPLAAGYIVPGMAVLCIDTGTELRLLSYGDAEAILAAAEEAATRAEAAADSLNLPIIQPGDAGKSLIVNPDEDGYELGSSSAGEYESRAKVEIAKVPPTTSFLRTAGYYAPGDGGAALYKRVLAEPLHSGKVKSSDGSWWEYIVEGDIVAAQFGVGIGSLDHADATTGLFNFAGGREVVFQPGTYNYSSSYTAPTKSRAYFPGMPGASVNYSSNSIYGLTRRYNYRREGTKGATWQDAKPRLGSIHEVADTYFLDSFQKQWSVGPTYWQWSDYEFGIHKEWNQNSDVAPNGWPQASIVGSAVSMSGNKDFPAGVHMLGFALGDGGSVWGFNSIIGNNVDVQVAGGAPRFLCGGEIDIQPSQGSNLTGTTGAGLLVNSFWTPVPFAGIAIVGDAGGSWSQGLYVGGIRSTGSVLQVAGGTACLAGIDLSGGMFSSSGIALPPNAPILTKTFTGASGSTIAGDNSGNTFIRQFNVGTSIKFQPSNDADNAEMFSIQTPTAGLQGFVARVANGATPNTAAAALWLRANGTSGRSLNAGGTINASGADYAEYERKSPTCGVIEKGHLVGFDRNGLLTDVFCEAVSFGVKSTDPNLVGGDMWMRELGERPVEPSFVSQLSWEGGAKPTYTKLRPHKHSEMLMRNWQKAYNKFRKKQYLELQSFREGCFLAWYKANVAYDKALEERRANVDRIAYCGKVPVNVRGASVGQHVLPAVGDNGSINGILIDEADLTFNQYKKSVGRVRRILADGRAEIVVKPI